MPQNTPMKRQFTTIDGRTVMSNLPQHWGGNDWKITGVDNPLPVGNYVQTESGVWIPQKGSDDGAADVRLTGSYVEQTELLARSVYRESQTSIFTIPEGVKGALFSLRSHGATGVFNENEGIRVGVRIGSRQWYSVYITTEWMRTSTVTSEILIYPGVDLGDAEKAFSTVSLAISKLNLQWANQGRWYVDIRGQIGEDEGFDAELFVRWLY